MTYNLTGTFHFTWFLPKKSIYVQIETRILSLIKLQNMMKKLLLSPI